MSQSLIFALLSLACAGANDVVFKRYALKDRSRGMVIFGIGLVWAVLQAGQASLAATALDWNAATLAFGVAAGTLLVLSNLLFLESLTQIPVSLGSTIYRLNTIGVLVLAFLVLGEPLGLMKVGGILLGIAGVLLLYRKDGGVHPRLFVRYCGLAVAASGLRAAYGVVSKAGIAQGADPQAMLLILALCWVVGGAGYAVWREGRFRLTVKKAAYALVSGTLVYLIVGFLMAALKRGEASVVIAVANLGFVVALLLSVTLRLELLTPRKLGAVACAAGAIGLLMRA
jgi:drug/metabolite transporter (DMT)-like permease